MGRRNIISKLNRPITKGATVAILIILVSSGVVQLFFASTYAQTAPPLFSVTLIVRSDSHNAYGNAARQYASIIANNMISLGIDARVVYVNYADFLSRYDFENSTLGAPFNKGGYDMLLVGNGELEFLPAPDFRSIFDGNPAYLPTACPWESCPVSPNYSLYNNTQLNNLLNELYSTTDTQTQIDLAKKWQEIVFNDSPYAYICQYADIVPRNPKWTAWGEKNVYSGVNFPDIDHFSGGNTFTLAVPYSFKYQSAISGLPAGNGSLNPAGTLYADTELGGYYENLVYGDWGNGANLLATDPRDLSVFPALATNVTSSPNGLDWNVQLRHGVLFQSGVEVTSDDFVWSRWMLFNPKSRSTFQSSDLGNVIDFTFLNGTTVTIDNRASADEPVRHGWWKAVDRYSLQIHLSQPYPFTREVYTGILSFLYPKHILEKFPLETWETQPFSTARSYTYTWDTAKYGGTGSYTAVGPVGAGPYYMESYNFTTNVAALKKFHQYWNATGLEALGQFSVETYRIVVIPDKQQALQAMRNGTVDEMDTYWYDLSGSDLPTLKSMGISVIVAPNPFFWRELGFNMRHPVLGTGVDTPLGKINPSMAAEAARHVRKAISHLIPRDQIVNEMMGGVGVPMASFLSPSWGAWYNKDLKPDSYDNNTAAAELRAAGYTVGGISTLAPTQSTPFWLLGGAVVVAVGLTSSMVVVIRKRKREGSLTTKQMVPTGYADLEGLLHGGIPVGYAVLLLSPPCDERDLLLRKILKANLSSGMQVFSVSSDLGRSQELVRSFPKEFYAFCPEAHRVASVEKNLYEIPGVGNLVEFNILLNKGLSDHASEGKVKVIVMDLLSDLLYRHKAAVTRKWLTEFIAKRKAQQFTTLCTLNPAMASKEETSRILDLFDGIIEIYEKESEGRLKRFLVIRKMYGQDYSETELPLERAKLL